MPVVTGLKKQGANDGASLAFMIATPESGVDSIAVSWAMLDPVMTVIRPVASFITAVSTGIVQNFFGEKPKETIAIADNINSGISCSCCAHRDAVASETTQVRNTLFSRLSDGLRFSFKDLLMDIAKPFAIGIVIAGIITFFFPDDLAIWSQGHPFLSMLVMLIAGIPMYVCATASTPIAAALILKGLNPGAALVFLLTGPATNAATMGIIKNIFSTRALFIYLFMVSACSLAMGSILDLIYNIFNIQASAVVGNAAKVIPHNLELAGVIILTSLIVFNYWNNFRTKRFKSEACDCH